MRIRTTTLVLFMFVVSTIVLPPIPVFASEFYQPQVGVEADHSIGSVGVSAAIRTNLYAVAPGSTSFFWVGMFPGNDFIQFGYEILEPGYYCTEGTLQSGCTVIQVGQSDGRWFWQYWPKGFTGFYGGIGPQGSAGFNGTWRSYSIVPNGTAWSLRINGFEVDRVPFRPVASTSLVDFVAETGTSSSKSVRLGPVEFRNLALLNGDGWHYATSLRAYVGCSVHTPLNCENPYGVSENGSGGYLIAGSGVTQPGNGDLVWSGQPTVYPVSSPTLTLSLPPRVQATLDGTFTLNSTSGGVEVKPGVHNINLIGLVALDSNRRLRFDHWNDGNPRANRTIDVGIAIDSYDAHLEAIYVQQYRVTVTSDFSRTPNSDWYDEFQTITLSAPSQMAAEGIWGLLGAKVVFKGWYENGSLISSHTSFSLQITAPHNLTIVGVTDYNEATVPVSITSLLCIVLAVVLFAALRRRDHASPPKD
jgi:hypothetical protein